MARIRTLFEPEAVPFDCLRFERAFWENGFELVAGVDEVGRGCLAGPVVACAVILPEEKTIHGVKDSKALTPKARERLAEEIKNQAIAWSVGIVGPEEIDAINILNASLKAMRIAVCGLNPGPDALLVDGNQPFETSLPLKTIPKGDTLSHSIAAASIIAKVYRDSLMVEYHARYPAYGFSTNKGYPTRGHREAISRFGPCPIHRKSFKGVRGAGDA